MSPPQSRLLSSHGPDSAQPTPYDRPQRARGDGRLRLEAITHLRPHSGWDLSPHQHPDIHELVYVREGTYRTRLGVHELELGPGDAAFYPQNIFHCPSYDFCSPVIMTVVTMTGNLPEHTPPHLLRGHVQNDLARGGIILDWMNERYPAVDETADHQLDLYCATLLGEMSQPPNDLVTRVAQWVQTHLDESLSLDDLAAHVGLSRYHFLRRFRAATGSTPMRFVRRKRIAQACHLLRSSMLSLQHIAEQVGVSSPDHLRRLVYKETGMTIREHRTNR
jgi:AraC-like DNA-binding protein/mannose-6-phosphate isomerase-like protein (cupin superfamily)